MPWLNPITAPPCVKPPSAPLMGTDRSGPASSQLRPVPTLPSRPLPCPSRLCLTSPRHVLPQTPPPGVTFPKCGWPQMPPPHQTRQMEGPLPNSPVQSQPPLALAMWHVTASFLRSLSPGQPSPSISLIHTFALRLPHAHVSSGRTGTLALLATTASPAPSRCSVTFIG